MIKYGVTEAGFIRKPYKEIETDIQKKARVLFGEDVDLSVYSPIGLFASLLAWNSDILWQELEHVYNSNWLETAEGVNLDRVVSLGGLDRKPAQYATIRDVEFSGKPGTKIEKGFKIETKEGVGFRTLNSEIIGIKLICDLVIGKQEITVQDGQGEIVSELTEKMMVYGEGIQNETEIESIENKKIKITKPADKTADRVELRFGTKAFINCNAIEPGFGGAVPANSVTEIAESLEGLDKVNNENSSFGAADIETDAALRKRYRKEGVENIGSSVDAIRDALSKKEGVMSVVQENYELSAVNGLPPKSVECMILGEGWDKEKIARTIFNTKSAGIATYGNEMCEITYDNKKYEIHFTRPVKVDIEIELHLIVNDEWENAIEDVKANVSKYISELDPGSTIYPWRIRSVNKDVKGIEDIDTVLINGDSKKFTLGSREIPNIKDIKVG